MAKLVFISFNSSSRDVKFVCNCFLDCFSVLYCSRACSYWFWNSTRWFSDFCKSSRSWSQVCDKLVSLFWFSVLFWLNWFNCNCKSAIRLVAELRLVVNSTFCFSKSRIFSAFCFDSLLRPKFRCSAVWWLCSINLLWKNWKSKRKSFVK